VCERHSVVEFLRVQSKSSASLMRANKQIQQIGWNNSEPRQSGCPSIVAAGQALEFVWKMQSIA
jgi:hypothetical protein